MELKTGDKVLYLNFINATVLSVAKNGVKISFWGRGLKEGELITKRVSKSDVRPR